MRKLDEVNVFKYVDEVARLYIGRFIRLWNKLKRKKFDDDAAFILYIDKMYDDLYKMSLESYAYIAKHYGKKSFGEKWVKKNVLDAYDPVTLYVFSNEIERRKGRHIENVLASSFPQKEHDKALKSWTSMYSQYADTVADKANIEKLKETEDEVVWVTERDNRVCRICKERSGEVYKISAVPPKPHIGCRCWLEKVNGD